MTDDAVDRIVRQWRSERPDLDPTPLLVFGRIQRVAAAMDVLLRPPFAEAGLGSGDFDALAALRRAGEPYRLSPTELAHAMLVTTGAVTKRVDRLIARGLVFRDRSSMDGRGRTVGLTQSGVELVDRLIETHLDNEHALLRALPAQDVDTLARLLGTLAADLEKDDTSGRE